MLKIKPLKKIEALIQMAVQKLQATKYVPLLKTATLYHSKICCLKKNYFLNSEAAVWEIDIRNVHLEPKAKPKFNLTVQNIQ